MNNSNKFCYSYELSTPEKSSSGVLNGIMEKGKKRERNMNYSPEDTIKLVTLVQKYKNIVENKKSDAVTWQEKERAWRAIEAEYNCSAPRIFRDAKHLKVKYEAIKRDTRKKLLKTDGDVNRPPLTPIEEKVKNIISLSTSAPLSVKSEFKSEGDESTCDSDQLDNGATKEEFIVVPDFPQCTVSVDNLDIPMTDSDTDDGKPNEKSPFNKLAEGKLEIVQLQKTLIEEELKEKQMKKQMMEMEMQYKRELYELEKEEKLLKISILKCELENKK